MDDTMVKAAKAVDRMEEYLRTVLQGKKRWENTYVKKQIDKREQGEFFSLSDHIRGMVYAMLSSGISWERMEKEIDENTGRIPSIDTIFHSYDADFLLSCSADKLKADIKEKHFAGLSTNKQVDALISRNISQLKHWNDSFGSIDAFYQKFIEVDSSYGTLIKTLSQSDSENKMKEMSEALSAEYLRNVGYDLSKPDRHIRRILGSNLLACSEEETVPAFEAMRIIREIAELSGKKAAYVDYILWSYCATGYGEICTVKRPMCCQCIIRDACRAGQNSHIPK